MAGSAIKRFEKHLSGRGVFLFSSRLKVNRSIIMEFSWRNALQDLEIMQNEDRDDKEGNAEIDRRCFVLDYYEIIENAMHERGNGKAFYHCSARIIGAVFPFAERNGIIESDDGRGESVEECGSDKADRQYMEGLNRINGENRRKRMHHDDVLNRGEPQSGNDQIDHGIFGFVENRVMFHGEPDDQIFEKFFDCRNGEKNDRHIFEICREKFRKT